MQRATLERDAEYDGVFYSAVRTTGVFCRPSCPARKPLPRNVEYFATTREALFSGYRPCKKCRPMESNGALPAWIADLIAEVETDPTRRIRDADLLARGLDPARVRRTFLGRFGLTFHAYARARRMGQAFQRLKKGEQLDDVVLDHGFESYSGFRDAYARTFGVAPHASRGSDCILASWLESPLGPLVTAATSDGICLLEFSDRRMLEAQFEALRRRFRTAVIPGENEHLVRLRTELTEYFAGTRREFSLSLVAPGTPFQERVWSALRTIPYGQTLSYQGLAEAVGSPGASRAAGRANGMNRIAILIPCHRVVQKDGTIGGYGGGVWRKVRLLELEGVRFRK
jgi:AraC family transcriptional regulator of adaptative response/methylated-DNA-[protein]-cysteine methyltransferase